MDTGPKDTEQRRALARAHAGLVLAVTVCSAGFGFELWRALSGNELSWAYVVEWPLLLVVAVHYWKLMVDHARGRSWSRPRSRREAVAVDEVALAAWNRYVAGLESEAGIDGTGL